MARKRLTITAGLGALAILAVGCGSSSSSSSTGTTGSQSSSSGGASGSGAAASKTKTTTTSAAAPAATGNALKLSADPSGALKFTTTKLSAKSGTVTIKMVNPSGVPHSIAIKGNGVNQLSPQAQVSGGQTATVTAKLKPGTYEFFCPIPGHEAAGMKGTLTVT